MSTWVESPRPGAFEGGSGTLSEIDRALAVIGAAHWIENVRTAAQPGDRPQAPRSIGRFGASIPVPAVRAERPLLYRGQCQASPHHLISPAVLRFDSPVTRGSRFSSRSVSGRLMMG